MGLDCAKGSVPPYSLFRELAGIIAFAEANTTFDGRESDMPGDFTARAGGDPARGMFKVTST